MLQNRGTEKVLATVKRDGRGWHQHFDSVLTRDRLRGGGAKSVHLFKGGGGGGEGIERVILSQGRDGGCQKFHTYDFFHFVAPFPPPI